MKVVDNALFGSPTPLLPFDIPGDLGNASEYDPAPVIVINPRSSDDALLSSAMARASRLEQALDAWRSTSDSDILAADVAAVLYAGSYEVFALLNEMWRRRHTTVGGAV